MYWHASNRYGPDWATDYLSAPVCDWSAQEIDFVDWVFNSSVVLRERASLMDQHEGLTYERDAVRREPFALRSSYFAKQSHIPAQAVSNPNLQSIFDGLQPIFFAMPTPMTITATHGGTMQLNAVGVKWCKTFCHVVEFLLNPMTLTLKYRNASKNEILLRRVTGGTTRVRQLNAPYHPNPQ